MKILGTILALVLLALVPASTLAAKPAPVAQVIGVTSPLVFGEIFTLAVAVNNVSRLGPTESLWVKNYCVLDSTGMKGLEAYDGAVPEIANSVQQVEFRLGPTPSWPSLSPATCTAIVLIHDGYNRYVWKEVRDSSFSYRVGD